MHPTIPESELSEFLKRLLASAEQAKAVLEPSQLTHGPLSALFKTLAAAQGMMDRIKPRDSRPGPGMSIDYLELSVMATNHLKAAGINTLGEILACTESSLKKIPSLGGRSIRQIKEAIAPYGSLAEPLGRGKNLDPEFGM